MQKAVVFSDFLIEHAVVVYAHTNSARPCVEDNLQQLAEIHENIQRMRLENASAAAAANDHSHRPRGFNFFASSSRIRQQKFHNSRLSTSCPSLSKAEEELANNRNNNNEEEEEEDNRRQSSENNNR